MNLLAIWNAHSARTKVIVGSLVSAAIYISANQQAQAFVLLTFKNNLALGTWLIALAGLVATLMSPHSDAGAVAHAQTILNQPDAPTASPDGPAPLYRQSPCTAGPGGHRRTR